MDYSNLLSAIAFEFAKAKAYLSTLENSLRKISPGTLYVRNDRGRVVFSEYFSGKREKYLKRNSTRLYELLRQQFLEFLLLHIKYQLDFSTVSDSLLQKQTAHFGKLLNHVQKASLDIRRITLSGEQYAWAHGNFRQKQIKSDTVTYTTISGVVMRSKSETIIGNILELLGIPYRYEAQLRINALPLIRQLEKELRSAGQLKGSLYYPKGNSCYWNVPEEYQWMNAPGSIWRSFDYRSGYITIYPDFTIKLSDGRLLFIEHEGLADNFRYRCNASERVFVLRQLGVATDETIICTFETDIQNEASLVKLFAERIMPKVFF